MVQTKEERDVYNKAYYKKNREKLLEKQKQYNEQNKEKIFTYHKQYNEQTKEKISNYQQKYYKSIDGKKIHTINCWKKRGLINDNYSELYDYYLTINKCNVCNYVFDDSNWRCMDHDHQTSLFRQILCNNCNKHDSWMNKI